MNKCKIVIGIILITIIIFPTISIGVLNKEDLEIKTEYEVENNQEISIPIIVENKKGESTTIKGYTANIEYDNKIIEEINVLNEDGQTGSYDSKTNSVIQYTITKKQAELADVNKDGKINATDALQVQRLIAGEISTFGIENNFQFGDVNMDGQITKKDADLVLRSIEDDVKLNATQKILADVNNNDKVDQMDAMYIIEYIKDNTTKFPVNNEYKYGDVNKDNKITQEDAQMVLSASVKEIELTEEEKKLADVDNDRNVNSTDGMLILRYVEGEITEFPIARRYRYGDVNNDGKINNEDAQMILSASVKEITLSEQQKILADLDNNGEINSSDALLVQRYNAKEIKYFPVEEINLYGDVNLDGKITKEDAQLILNASVKEITLTEKQKELADLNGDGQINAVDGLFVLRYIANEIANFPISIFYDYGDVNMDGKITKEDAELILRISVKEVEIDENNLQTLSLGDSNQEEELKDSEDIINNQQQIGNITLKLKDIQEDTTTQIQLKNIEIADDDSQVSLEDKTINVKIKTSNTQTNTSNNITTNNMNKSEDNTVANKILPNTGIRTLIIVAIIITIISAVFFKVKSRKF